MNSTKITTVYLTNVEDTLQIKSYFELYEGIFNNIDFSSKNENLELQLNNYCNSLNSAIKSILEYIKTHNVDVEYHYKLARKINNILYEFKNKMQEFGIAIDNSENIREAYLFYKAIAKKENLLHEKTYLYNADEREKKFLDFIKIDAQEIKEAEVKEKHPKENNKFDWIFSNNGYELFSYILENHIAKKGIRGRINDLSFYYWSMFNSTPKYIHQRPEVFKVWFCEKYEDNFSKIKTYYEANDKKGNRKRHFQTSLDWFKNQK